MIHTCQTTLNLPIILSNKHPMHPHCSKFSRAYWGQCGAPPSGCGSCRPCIPERRWGGRVGWGCLWAMCAPCPGASYYACGAGTPCGHGGVHGTCGETVEGQKPHRDATYWHVSHWNATHKENNDFFFFYNNATRDAWILSCIHNNKM